MSVNTTTTEANSGAIDGSNMPQEYLSLKEVFHAIKSSLQRQG